MDFNTLFIWTAIVAGIYLIIKFIGKISGNTTPPVSEEPQWPENARLNACKIKQSTLELQWPEAETSLFPVSVYIIYQGKEEIGRHTPEELSCKVLKLKAGTTYSFSVIAENTKGLRSKPLTCKTSTLQKDKDKPVWPAGTKLDCIQKRNQLVFTWPEASDRAGIRKYRLYQDDVLAGETTSSVRTLNLAKPEVGTYEFRVEAGDKAGNWSDDGPRTTVSIYEQVQWRPGAALTFSVTDEKVTITWPQPTGNPASFRISTGDEPAITIAGSQKEYIWIYPAAGTFEISVEACDAAGFWSKQLKGQVTLGAPEEQKPVWPGNAALVFDPATNSFSWPAAIGETITEKYELRLDDRLIASTEAGIRQWHLQEKPAAGMHRASVFALAKSSAVSAPLELLFTIDSAEPLPNWPPNASLHLTRTETGIKMEWTPAAGPVRRYRIMAGEKILAVVPAETISFILGGLQPGNYIFSVQAGNINNEFAGQSLYASWTEEERDTEKPGWPSGAQLEAAVSGRRVNLKWTPATDNIAVARYLIYLNDQPLSEVAAGENGFTTASLPPGLYSIHMEAADAAGNVSVKGPQQSVTIPDQLPAPAWKDGSRIVTELEEGAALVKWPVPEVDAEKTLKAYRLIRNGVTLIRLAAGENTYRITVKPGETYNVRIEAQDSGEAWSVPLETTISIPAAQPPITAPPLDLTQTQPFDKTIDFIFGGSDPQQKGVSPGTLRPQQSTVLKGRVTDITGKPQKATTVTVLHHPEYGTSTTDENGIFHLVVNGGSTFVIRYEAQGKLVLQRTIETGWQEFKWLPDVALREREPVTGNVSFPVAEGAGITAGEVQDDHGRRKASVFFPEATTASVIHSDGTLVPAPQLNFRITEFTSGSYGPQAMPGELPATSGYTYAIEITAEEALAKVDGRDIVFDRDVFVCVDNFLGFPVGSPAPAGFFDDRQSSWVPSNDGRVIGLLETTGGIAAIDISGKGQPATAAELEKIGLGEEERKHLARTYSAGASLWRVPVRHFSIWDFNWPFGPPDDAKPGNSPEPDAPGSPDDPCEGSGSIIEYQTQVLGQEIPVIGTDFNLCYRSNRVPGHLESRTLDIPVTGSQYPASLKAIEMVVEILGQKTTETLKPSANLRYRYTWNMKDGFGRDVTGIHPVRVRMGFVYEGVYRRPGGGRSFAQPSGTVITGSRTRREVTLWSEWHGWTGLWDSRVMGLGGWTLDVQHFYDTRSRTLYLGDGTTHKSGAGGQNIRTVIGVSGTSGYSGDGGPASKAHINTGQVSEVHADGTLYIADWGNYRIRRMMNDGSIMTIAGIGEQGYSGDGGPALKAKFSNVHRVVAAKDGSFYVADQDNNCIRRIDAQGIVETFAGTGKAGFSGDGGPAKSAQLYTPRCLRLAADGTLYISDTYNHRIRKVTPDGIITTVAGDGYSDFKGDGGPAVKARISSPQEIFLTEDGKVYFADQGNNRIRCIYPDGTIRTVAGKGTAGFSGDGGIATEAELNSPEGFAVARDGTIYIADRYNHRIRMVSPAGIISTIAGSDDAGYDGDGGPAFSAQLYEPHAIALAHDGSIYVSDVGTHSIRKIDAPSQGMTNGQLLVSSDDDEQVFVFSSTGRHLRTIDALSGITIHLFHYENEQLSAIDCERGKKVTISRSSGKIVIENQGKERLSLSLNNEGFLSSIGYEDLPMIRIGYKNSGLLTDLQYPTGKNKSYSYDEDGRLTKATNGSLGTQQIGRKLIDDGYAVSVKHNQGWTKEYHYTKKDGYTVKTNFADGKEIANITSSENGDEDILLEDGTKVTYRSLPATLSDKETVSILRKTVILPSGLEQVTDHTVSCIFSQASAGIPVRTTQSVSAGTITSSITYDNEKKQITTALSGEWQQRIILNEKNDPVKMEAPDLLPIDLVYDLSGRLSSVIQGERRVDYAYNNDGKLYRIQDSENRLAVLDFDKRKFNSSKKIGSSSPAQYTYDSVGRLASAQAPSGITYTFAYDDSGNLITINAANGGTLSTDFTYNDFGQLTGLKRSNNTLFESERNKQGYISLEKSLRGERRYRYSPSGKLLEIESEEGKLTWTYDGPLMVSEKWTGEWSVELSFSYDSLFRQKEIKVAGEKIGYQFDGAGRIKQANDAEYYYNHPAGLHTGFKIDRSEKRVTWNEYGDIRSLSYLHDSIELIRWDYDYDKSGRIITEEITTAGKKTVLQYRYDENSNLLSVSRNGRETEFSYDADGNRVSEKTPDGQIPSSYKGELLQSRGAASFQYSAAGFLQRISGAGKSGTFQYERMGNLIEYRDEQNNHYEYVWDGLHRCIANKKNGVIKRRVVYLDTNRPAAETDEQGKVLRMYIYSCGSNAADYTSENGRNIVLASDSRGSAWMSYDAETGEILHSRDFDSFGNIIEESGTAPHIFGFAGGIYFPESGFTRFGIRDYDASTGRWTAPDPMHIGLSDFNLYAYCTNDPVNHTDPSGLAITKVIGKLMKLKNGQWKTIKKGEFKLDEVFEKIKDGFDFSPDEKSMGRYIGDKGSTTPRGSRWERHGPKKSKHIPDESPRGKQRSRKKQKYEKKYEDHTHNRESGDRGAPGREKRMGEGGGHILRGITAPLTFKNYTEGHGDLAEMLGELGDFFNPLSLPNDLLDIADALRSDGCP